MPTSEVARRDNRNYRIQEKEMFIHKGHHEAQSKRKQGNPLTLVSLHVFCVLFGENFTT